MEIQMEIQNGNLGSNEACAVKDYDPTVFAELNEFEDAQKCLASTREHLKALGSVICRHGLQQVVGVALLHRHFDIFEDEVVVKQFVKEEAYTKPLLKSGAMEAVPYLWKLRRDGAGGFGFYPLEFLCVSEGTEEAIRMTVAFEQADSFLVEIADVLVQLGAHDVFGIGTLHHAAITPVAPTEFLSETTDYENRTLRIRRVLRENAIFKTSAETLWRFSLSSGTGANPEVSCDVQCTPSIGIAGAMHCTCGPHRHD